MWPNNINYVKRTEKEYSLWQSYASLSSLSLSSMVRWSRNARSCTLQPFSFVQYCPVLHCRVPYLQVSTIVLLLRSELRSGLSVTAAYAMSHAAAVGSGCMSRVPVSTGDRAWHWRVSGDGCSPCSSNIYNDQALEAPAVRRAGLKLKITSCHHPFCDCKVPVQWLLSFWILWLFISYFISC